MLNQLLPANTMAVPLSRLTPGALTNRRGPVPAVVLGGSVNALSVVRSLGRMGVPVWVVGEADAPARSSPVEFSEPRGWSPWYVTHQGHYSTGSSPVAR